MKSHKKISYVIIAIICAVLFLIWFIKDREGDNFVMVDAISTEPVEIMDAVAQTSEDMMEMKVYIAGEVVNPGVYDIEDGYRIEDVLNLAGGPTDEANMLGVNLSQKVYDEQYIIIPKIGEEVDKSVFEPQNDSNGKKTDKVNINSADKQTLESLPGIGPSIAEAIIEYRESSDGFENIDDIKNVYRIGDKIFENIKDLISVN